jgi:TonB family protein
LAQHAITQPDWVRKPDASHFVWPRAALKDGIDGEATVACKVSAQGVLYDCVVQSESPVGLGFGQAALAMTPQFTMRPLTRDGQPVAGGTVRIPIRWKDMHAHTESYASGRMATIQWLKAPTFEDVLAAYPSKPRQEQVGGRATLSCIYSKDGRLSECQVITQSPGDLGFGTAAVKLEKLFRGPPLATALQANTIMTQVTVAFAPETLSGARTIGKPQWVGLPTFEDLKASFPAAAWKAGVLKARVVLSCNVAAEGGVEGCKVDTEEPAAQGFGAAALSVTHAFRLSVWTDEGLPTVGGTVRIPIRYDFSDAPPPAAKP